MLLAIDVGNTQTVYGLWDGHAWRAAWRRSTSADDTEDQLAAWLKSMFELAGIPFRVTAAISGSVVPQLRASLQRLADEWLGVPMVFLDKGSDVGLQVDYNPPTAVGADRLCNALGALALYPPPLIVVDFGTATTFDAIDRDGHYAGGAILPGIQVSTEALVGRTAKLPMIDLVAPETAIGKTTTHALQSGIVLGYADAIDGLTSRINQELGGGCTVLATGGLGGMFVDWCVSIDEYQPLLTLDGLRIAYERIKGPIPLNAV